MKIKLKDLINENILGELPSSKLMKMKWNPVKEGDNNAPIMSDPESQIDEVKDEEDLLGQVESQIDELIGSIIEESNLIGGRFGARSIILRIKKLILTKINTNLKP